MRLTIEIALGTGFRKGELLQLKEKDINTQKKLVCVANTKNGKCQWVSLTERSVTNFQELLSSSSSNLLPTLAVESHLLFDMLIRRKEQ